MLSLQLGVSGVLFLHDLGHKIGPKWSKQAMIIKLPLLINEILDLLEIMPCTLETLFQTVEKISQPFWLNDEHWRTKGLLWETYPHLYVLYSSVLLWKGW